MNRSFSFSPDWPAPRVARVLKALEELNRCVAERGRYGKSWGLTVGEMDWRSELHNELYGSEEVSYVQRPAQVLP
jgi:hypothetical protein